MQMTLPTQLKGFMTHFNTHFRALNFPTNHPKEVHVRVKGSKATEALTSF